MHGVKDVEEVLARWPLAYRILVRKVAHHVCVFLELRIERLHREFIVVLHVNVHYIVLLQQLLLAGEDILQKVFVNDTFVRQIELKAKYDEAFRIEVAAND